MRVLLTGPTGFLGRHILDRLLDEAEAEIHAVNRSGRGPAPGRVVWHAGDLIDRETARGLVRAVRPTHLLHNAWFATPGLFWSDPVNLSWLVASVDLIQAFAAEGGCRFVGVGSCAEYDWGAENFVEDVTPIRPATLYGRAKAAVAMAADAFAASGAITAGWGRVFLPYGPGDTPGRLLPTLIEDLGAGRPVALGPGQAERDFIFAADAADLLVRLLAGTANGAFNVGTGTGTSVADAARAAAVRLGRPDLLRFGTRVPPVGEPRRLVADMSKVRRVLGWTAPTPLATGLATIIR